MIVFMPDFSEKEVEYLNRGDRVQSYNSKENRYTDAFVNSVWNLGEMPHVEIMTETTSLIIPESFLVLVDRYSNEENIDGNISSDVVSEWVRAVELKEGDPIRTIRMNDQEFSDLCRQFPDEEQDFFRRKRDYITGAVLVLDVDTADPQDAWKVNTTEANIIFVNGVCVKCS